MDPLITNAFNIAKEIFPDKPDEFLQHALWEETGYPCFWMIPEDGDTPEECLRKQLTELKAELGK